MASPAPGHVAPPPTPRADTDAWIVPLERAGELGDAVCGPKASRLGRARRAGLETPPGFVVTTAAFEHWLHAPYEEAGERSSLLERLERACAPLEIEQARYEPETARRLASAAARIFARAPLPRALQSALEAATSNLLATASPGVRLAVRSSAPQEDAGERSWAGLFETRLRVDPREVADAVRAVFASSLSERAIAAALHGGQPLLPPRMAAIVQPMLEPAFAGILFTRDPLTGSERMVVEAVRGLGENVVAGRVEPARFVLDRHRGTIEREGGDRTLRLPDATLHALASLGRRLEELFHGPQDIEWAIEDRRLVLLQTRPITRLGTAHDGGFWTSANSQEALQGPVTPMTYTLMLPLIERGRQAAFAALGLAPMGGAYMRRHLGRVYFNTLYFRRFLEQLPGAPTEIFDMLLFGDATAAGSLRLDLGRLRPSLQLLRLLALAARTWLGARRRMDAYVPRLERGLRQLRAIELREATETQLLQALFSARALMERGFRLHVLGSAMAGGHYLLLAKWLQREVGALGQGSVDVLLDTAHRAETARAYDALLALARAAHARPAVAAWLAARAHARLPSERQLAELEQLEGGREVRRGIDRFLARYGHLARTEAELAAPRWREDVAYVFEVLRSLGDRKSPEQTASARRRARRRLIARIERALGRRNPLFAPLRRAVFGLLLRWAQRYAPYRENMRFHALRAYEQVRCILLEFGRRFAARGVLSRADDVFLLEWNELLAAARAPAPPPLAERAAARRRELEHHARLEAPKFIRDDGRPAPAPPRIHAAGAGAAFLEGVAVSGGIVRGRVRLCRSLEQALELEPDEILLARLAPPSWTPAFLLARGVILDVGGMLSHCAVIAREHGVPCVVGVRHGTEMLRDGEWVTLDASAGRVYVHRDAATGPAR